MTKPDPIFAAIAECRTAIDEYSTAVAAEQTTSHASDRSDTAAATLLNVTPTTVAGAAALLRFAFDVCKRNDWMWPDELGDDDVPWLALLCGHVADALEKMAARA
jgi:hypothetical protein